MITPNVHCQWHPLKAVWVGTTFLPDYYEDIKEPRVRDFFQKIAFETQEDLDNLAGICKSYGAEVFRPVADPNERLNRQLSRQKPFGVHRPPMQPRDAQCVVGNTFYLSDLDHPAFKKLAKETIDPNSYVNCFNISPGHPQKLDFKEHPHFGHGWGGAINLRYGRDIIISGKGNYHWFPEYAKTLYGEQYRIHVLPLESHTDVRVSILDPRTMIVAHNVAEHFTDWKLDKFVVDNNIMQNNIAYNSMSTNYKGKYWSPEAEQNPEICQWIDSYVAHWLDFSSVTFFDINVLSLDEKTIVSSSWNKDLSDWLKMRGIELIHSPLRHKFFWDGGTHCCTLDISRDGNLESYWN